ncbi:hypothetical protein RQP46_003979 [Phenoliferia psychrophenolica]
MSEDAAVQAAGPVYAPSRLGTKNHWDEASHAEGALRVGLGANGKPSQVYTREGKTFDEIGDEGDIWFGESAAEEMVEWISENLPTSASIADVGCGNGDLTFRLYDAGYTSITGIDYSEASINLARAISKRRDVPLDAATFAIRDVLSAEVDPTAPRYELVCDKGTYDGICLSDEVVAGKVLSALYPERIAGMVQPGGIFFITSCNWTRAELTRAFATPETGLKYYSHIPKPSFQFGGATGQTTTSVAFIKED